MMQKMTFLRSEIADKILKITIWKFQKLSN